MSIYPGQEFNRDDESLVNLGYWAPDGDDATAEVASQQEAEADEHSRVSETPDEPVVDEAPENPWAAPDQADAYASARHQESVHAASADMTAKVEMVPGGVKSAVEAILAVASTPVSTREFAAALLVSERAVETALDELYIDYNGGTDVRGIACEPRGFELRRINGGWRLFARADFSPWVARFVTGSQAKKLTRAQLETLAVIAYQQPVTRAYVAQVRGTSVDAAFRILKQRGFIEETVPEEGSGASQYITTGALLERLGFESLEQLPPLAPLLPDLTDLEVASS
ncbi:SMC-Scp complex subunit ScpB [Rothia sp. ZJ932]|uniref:SMC-Scp complex subunit ScpB n=1 Tax=Rothia sp. ZJ932 TaxID=2810516 RepID=UPI0019679A34|nr:SMC-Scp complex subunit ScpB [Rothia sp. ZJ932]QRZ60988.1 SMC-Scp complex subunit ScpB [Rothia sp. ZJ932]